MVTLTATQSGGMHRTPYASRRPLPANGPRSAIRTAVAVGRKTRRVGLSVSKRRPGTISSLCFLPEHVRGGKTITGRGIELRGGYLGQAALAQLAFHFAQLFHQTGHDGLDGAQDAILGGGTGVRS